METPTVRRLYADSHLAATGADRRNRDEGSAVVRDELVATFEERAATTLSSRATLRIEERELEAGGRTKTGAGRLELLAVLEL